MVSSLFPVSISHKKSNKPGDWADLVIVQFLNGVERIDLELAIGLAAVIRQELVLYCQPRSIIRGLNEYRGRPRSSLEYAWVFINARMANAAQTSSSRFAQMSQETSV